MQLHDVCVCWWSLKTGWFMLSPLPQSSVAYSHSHPAICSSDQSCLFLAICVLPECVKVNLFLFCMSIELFNKVQLSLLKRRTGSKGLHWLFFGLAKKVFIFALWSSKTCPSICCKADSLRFFTWPFSLPSVVLFEQVSTCAKLLFRV